MRQATTPPRLVVIDRQVLAHVLDHPARGVAWSLRELAGTLGCSHATIGHLLTGRTDSIRPELARRLAEAVGVEVPVLFAPRASTDSVDTLAPSGDAA